MPRGSAERIVLGSVNDEADVAAAAARADEPLAPSRHGRVGTVPASLLSRRWLAPVAARFAPNVERQMGCRGAAERHRRAGVGLHLAPPDRPLRRALWDCKAKTGGTGNSKNMIKASAAPGSD